MTTTRTEDRDVGNLERDGWELRYQDDGDLDEIVARGADVHLERMDDDCWCLILTVPSGETIHTFITHKNPKAKAHVVCNVFEHPAVKR